MALEVPLIHGQTFSLTTKESVQSRVAQGYVRPSSFEFAILKSRVRAERRGIHTMYTVVDTSALEFQSGATTGKKERETLSNLCPSFPWKALNT